MFFSRCDGHWIEESGDWEGGVSMGARSEGSGRGFWLGGGVYGCRGLFLAEWDKGCVESTMAGMEEKKSCVEQRAAKSCHMLHGEGWKVSE